LPANLVRNLIIAVIASIAFYGVWVLLAGPGDVWRAVQEIGVIGWLLILGLSLFNYLARFVRWQMYLLSLGYRVPGWPSLRFYVAGFAFTATPGKVGEAVRSLYLKRFAVKYADSIATFFVERLVDVVAMVLLSLLAASVFDEWRWLIAIVGGLLILLLPAVRSHWLRDLIASASDRIASVRMQAAAVHLLQLLAASGTLLRATNLYGGLLLGVLAWAAEGMALYVVVQMLGFDISVPLAVGIYGVSILAGALSFVPGGLGGTEIVMGALLILIGVTEPVAVSAVLICRLATLWFAVAIGVLVTLELELGSGGRYAMVARKAGGITGIR
jgi:glycosyltransferase 2 family protein